MHLIDCYAHSNRLRDRHPAEKALFEGGFLILSLFAPPLLALVILMLMFVAASVGARIPVRIYLRIMIIPVAFILMGAAPLLVSLSFKSGSLSLAMDYDHLNLARTLIARALAASSCLNFLALTTPAYEWIPFLRKAGVPSAIADITLLVYRLLFIFAERLTSMQMAQSARLGYATSQNTLRSSGMLGANLFLRTLVKARRMEIGLAARGLTGELPLLPFENRPSRAVMTGIGFLWLATAATLYLYRRGGHV